MTHRSCKTIIRRFMVTMLARLKPAKCCLCTSINFMLYSGTSQHTSTIDRMKKDLVYFLDPAELIIVEILILISNFLPDASISVYSQRLFCTATCPLGACTVSVCCPEIGGCPYLGG